MLGSVCSLRQSENICKSFFLSPQNVSKIFHPIFYSLQQLWKQKAAGGSSDLLFSLIMHVQIHLSPQSLFPVWQHQQRVPVKQSGLTVLNLWLVSHTQHRPFWSVSSTKALLFIFSEPQIDLVDSFQSLGTCFVPSCCHPGKCFKASGLAPEQHLPLKSLCSIYRIKDTPSIIVLSLSPLYSLGLSCLRHSLGISSLYIIFPMDLPFFILDNDFNGFPI